MSCESPSPERIALPLSRTPLVGRDREVNAVCDLVVRDDVALVTLSGPGGVGKTRLALTVAQRLRTAPAFPDGVEFVSLSSVNEADLVIGTIAQTLGLRDAGEGSIFTRLISHLAALRLFLVLDNFEQVVSAAPQIVNLLDQCPGVTILVTSRSRLRVSVEWEFIVPPLTVIHPEDARRDAELPEAVRLFIDRARQVNQAFSPNPDDVTVITEICRRVDGLPLAVELAAAQVKVLPPSELLRRFEHRLPLLTGGSRDLPVRQQTMRDTISWSNDLLTDLEQRVFHRLALFVGGFGIEAAEVVALTSEAGATDRFGVVAALIDHSLLQTAPERDGEPRFTMLETLREFGLERLTASGDLTEMRDRHAEYYLSMAETSDLIPYTLEKDRWIRRVETELPNLRAALEWTNFRGDADALIRFVNALWWFWELRGYLSEASSWLARAVEISAHDTRGRQDRHARLLAHAAMAALWQGQEDRATDLLNGMALAVDEVNDQRIVGFVHLSLGHLAIHRGDWDQAILHFDQALTAWRMLEDWSVTTDALFRLGYVKSLQRDMDGAEGWFDECCGVARTTGWPTAIAFSLEALGTCALDRKDVVRAAGLFAEALELGKDGVDTSLVANCLKSLARVASLIGHAITATRLLSAAEVVRRRRGFVPPRMEQERIDRVLSRVRSMLSSTEFNRAWSDGQQLPVETAIAEAFSIAEQVASVSTTKPPKSQPATASGLTPREIDVVRLLAEGRSDREIAELLFVSRPTASNHVSNILSKLGVGSRAAAATWAVRNGLDKSS